MSLAPLPWHGPQWQQLARTREADRLPHALLLHGPAGVGKRAFAEVFAAALLCQRPTAAHAACGECRGCRLFLAGSHPDTLRVQAEAPGKPIKVDQVRALCAFLDRTTEFGGAKVVRLEAAERMNTNAANSLLKTLEEPTPGSVLLLISTHPTRLPATVRSRCQQLAFQRPDSATALPWLEAQLADAGDPALLLQLAQNAPLAALALADPARLQRRRKLFQSFCQLVVGQSGALDDAALWQEGEVAENLGWLLDWHMDLIRLKMAPEPAGLQNPDLLEGLQGLAARLPTGVLFTQLEAVASLHALAATPANMSLQIEAFLAQYPLAGRRRTSGG